MSRWLLTKLIDWTKTQVGDVNMDYAYHLRDVTPGRLWRHAMIKVVEGNRKFVPVAAYHAAGMAAAMVEDCGPCVQTHVNLALKDGVDAGILRALAARRLESVPAEVALAFNYGDCVAQGAAADELRDQIRAKWGEPGLIELAFTIAVARFYPAVKRGMGYAQSCERIVIDNRPIATAKAA
jgi:AhpD family alkylhydroperoxidase